MSIPVRRIPLIGSDLAKIGQVYQILAQPCQPEPSMWVQAFWTGIPKAIWSVVKPDPTDYLTERFGSVHSRKRKRRFNIDDIMETKYPVGKGWGWAAWQNVRLAERVGWYLLIADVTAEFLVNWTSTAYLWGGCPVPGAKYRTNEPNTSIDMIYGAGTYIYPLWSPTAVNGISGNSYWIDIPAGQNYSVQAQLSAAPPSGAYPTALPSNVSVIDFNSGEILGEAQHYDLDDGSRSFYAFIHNSVFEIGRRVVAVQWTQGAGGWRATGGCFSAATQPNQLILPDP